MKYIIIHLLLINFYYKYIFSYPACNSVNFTEYSNLQNLYDSLNGNNWRWNYTETRWNFSYTGNDPCNENWTGIKCESVNNQFCNGCRIVNIDITNRTAQGSIELINLSSFCGLRSVKMPYNKLYGSITNQLIASDGLENLDLSFNYLNGSILSDLLNKSNLTTLNLANNKFTNQLPEFLNLPKLNYLVLRNNKFTGEFPNSIS